jgi:predicted metal-binding protein
MKKGREKDRKHFSDMALKLGADHAVFFKIEDIVFDPRSVLKCMFGCYSVRMFLLGGRL